MARPRSSSSGSAMAVKIAVWRERLPQALVREQAPIVSEALERGVVLRHRQALEADDQRVDQREEPDQQQDQDRRGDGPVPEIPLGGPPAAGQSATRFVASVAVIPLIRTVTRQTGRPARTPAAWPLLFRIGAGLRRPARHRRPSASRRRSARSPRPIAAAACRGSPSDPRRPRACRDRLAQRLLVLVGLHDREVEQPRLRRPPSARRGSPWRPASAPDTPGRVVVVAERIAQRVGQLHPLRLETSLLFSHWMNR